MKTVLFAWELGGGYGHVASLRRFAAQLHPHGLRLVAAAKDMTAAAPLRGAGIEIVPAPAWPETPQSRQTGSSATMGDRLASAGLADPDVLPRLLAGWSALLRDFDPALVVTDFAPAAALAARGRVPLLMIGNGYTLPPSEMTHFPLLHRLAEPVWDERRLVTIVNKAAHSIGAQPLTRLTELFAADARVVESFPLLDPHNLQRLTPADGPAFDAPPLPQCDDAETIFVYLSPGYPIPRALIAALTPFAGHLRIHAPDLSSQDNSELARRGARIEPQPVALSEALTTARLVVHFGGSGMASHALAAGVPQLVLAAQIEQEINGKALQLASAGMLVPAYDPDFALTPDMVAKLRAPDPHATQLGAQHREWLRHNDVLTTFERAALRLLGWNLHSGHAREPARK